MVKRKEKIEDPLKLLLPGVIPNKLCCLPNNPRTEDKKISGNPKGLPLCDSARIQTWNRLIRSQVLYSVELRSHCFVFAGAKVLLFFEFANFLAMIIIRTNKK